MSLRLPFGDGFKLPTFEHPTWKQEDLLSRIREAKTRSEFFLEYNQRFAEYRQQIAEYFNVDESILPEFGLCSIERIIEITASKFPEMAREAVVLELEAMAENG